MDKFVVYTVLTGSESSLNNPFQEKSEDFERICLTDDISIEPNGWKLVELDTHLLDPGRASRRPKLLPHIYFPEFEWSLYVDNTVRFKTSPLEILQTYVGRELNYWCFKHPWRDCVYDEAEEVIRLGYDDERRVREQMDYYRALGYPKKAGLCANTVLLRKHNDPRIIQLGDIWFDHVLRFSKRDQLSCNFVARHLNFEFGYFSGELIDNQFIVWPGYSGQSRLPQDFDEYVYGWLNPEVHNEVQKSGLSLRKHFMAVGVSQRLPYKKKLWRLDQLANKYKSDKGTLYYNAHGYAALYERYFDPIKDHSIRLLEIGLLRHDIQARNPGGPYDDTPSLFMWREYFPNAEIVGFDIADFTKAPVLPGCKIVRGDMGNPDHLLSVMRDASGTFDIIIDDGSHASHHQQLALGILFPYLKEGGYYVIEDLNYQPPQLEERQAIKTKQILHALCCGITLHTKFISREQLTHLAENSEIEFYDSFDRNFGDPTSDAIVFIRKSRKNPADLSRSNNLTETASGCIMRSVLLEKEQITRMLTEKEKLVQALSARASERDRKIQALTAQISKICESRSWRWTGPLRKVFGVGRRFRRKWLDSCGK
ncbi:MAG: DUF616 domain-containing protein [Acidobacteriia bacterium]|nr:DUF616 domain-containing protein [Terriglobia bacterium]